MYCAGLRFSQLPSLDHRLSLLEQGKLGRPSTAVSADHLLQCLIDDFEFLALQEQNGGDSAAILQVGNRTQRAEAGGFTKRSLDRLSQRNLRLGHRRALRLGSG